MRNVLPRERGSAAALYPAAAPTTPSLPAEPLPVWAIRLPLYLDAAHNAGVFMIFMFRFTRRGETRFRVTVGYEEPLRQFTRTAKNPTRCLQLLGFRLPGRVRCAEDNARKEKRRMRKTERQFATEPLAQNHRIGG